MVLHFNIFSKNREKVLENIMLVTQNLKKISIEYYIELFH